MCTDGLANKGVGKLDGDTHMLDEQELSVILVCSFCVYIVLLSFFQT